LLNAGAGQTMERDPDTGIVQVRTGSSDQVQQYDPATGEVSSALRTGSDAAQVYENLLDAFSNPNSPTFGPGTDYADAGGDGDVVFDAGAGVTNVSTNPNSFTNFLGSQGSSLTPAQQDALATQIDSLGLGGEGDVSFYALPGGGVLIANANGDIVGEINRSATGDLNLKATVIDGNGNSFEVNNHIGEQGQVVSDNAMVQAQASNMFNSLMAVNNWDHLSDLGKLSALVNLYNATDKLGEAFGATGDNLPGDLGAAAGYLQLAQGIQSGDNLVIANGINVVSDGALDGAMNQAFGNTAASLSSKLVDVDGEGYLEQTQWLQSNQAVLAVDLNSDGQISVGETVNLQGGAQDDQARTSMQWLHVNGDHRFDASDPAFTAANDELFKSMA
jgi:hypothetical protein